ncbi:lipopolysaccharide biosynthesis protein, partial [Clostridium perfringens]
MYLANKKIDKEYKNLLTWSSDEEIDEIKTENKLIGKNIGDIFFHKIGTFVVKQTDAIVISIFSTLVETGIYANYLLIINSLSGLVANTIGSVMPSIGNLIADESREKSYKIFKRLYLLDNLIALFLSVCLYFVIDKFILWWVGQEYIFSKYCVIALIL